MTENCTSIIGGEAAAYAMIKCSCFKAVMVIPCGLSAIGRTIHPYPTQAEAIRKLADAYNRSRLTPMVRRLLAGWLRGHRYKGTRPSHYPRLP